MYSLGEITYNFIFSHLFLDYRLMFLSVEVPMHTPSLQQTGSACVQASVHMSFFEWEDGEGSERDGGVLPKQLLGI